MDPKVALGAELHVAGCDKLGVVLVEASTSVPVAAPLLGPLPPAPITAAKNGGASLQSSVYALSDLHTDFPKNLELLRSLPAHPEDAIILAGDITHDLMVFRQTLDIFKSKFRHVFFCPGNHDLWVHRGDGCKNSIQKLDMILALCDKLGVHTKPVIVGDRVLVVPLLSWYEPGFDADPDVQDESILRVEETMSDFLLCTWPPGLSASDASLAEHFDTLNGELPDTQDCKAVISFSHFLPRPELLPEKRYLFYPNLPKAAGSRTLGARVQRLRPHCHIFGHTHYGWDAKVGDVRYLQAPVAYPRERDTRGFALRLCEGAGGFVGGHVAGGVTSPTLVYDGATGQFPQWSAFWSGHYSRHPRRPADVRWLYREPRVREQVGKVLKRLVDSGEDVDDEVVERLLVEAAA